MRLQFHLCAGLLLLAFGVACTVEPSAKARSEADGPAGDPAPIDAAAPPGPEGLGASPTPLPSCRARRTHDLDPSIADAGWKRRIEKVAGRLSMGVAVGIGGRVVYTHRGQRARTPASNEKLLLSFALFDRLGPHHRIPTRAIAREVDHGTIPGNLWVMGRGDPTLTDDEPSYWADVDATTLAGLARRIERSGVKRIDGRVMGATGYFAHDLDAPGWQPYVPERYVQLPSALVVKGNYAGKNDPERAVAAALTKQLERIEVSVRGHPGSGRPPAGSSVVASVRSRPLAEIVSYMNHTSNNFFAEMLGKLLGANTFGPPGTIEKGARAIQAWARKNGVRAIAHDSSGLSYDNRVSPRSIVELLGVAETRPWGATMRVNLPASGEGTLGYRLTGIDVRAKTGSLFNGASALSGWVRSTRSGRWIAFSILDRHAPKTTEDRVVRIIARARIPIPKPERLEACGPSR